MSNNFFFRIIWCEEDKQYFGLCREFPSLSWGADTAIDALEGIMKLVVEVLKDE